MNAEGNSTATKANHKTIVLQTRFIVRESAWRNINPSFRSANVRWEDHDHHLQAVDNDNERYNIQFNSKTPKSPIKEIRLSIIVQDKKVCFNDRLKNSLNIQKPESLI